MLLKCKKCGKKLFIDLEEDVLLCEVCDEWSNIKPVLQYILDKHLETTVLLEKILEGL